MQKRTWPILTWRLVLAMAFIAMGLTQVAYAAPAGQEKQPVEPGLVIVSVVPGSPADQAGLVRGNILLEVNGEAVDTVPALLEAIQGLAPGDEVELLVLHGDEERTLVATLTEGDGSTPFLGILPATAAPRRLAAPPAQALRTFRMFLDGEGGAMVVQVAPDSPAEQAELQAGTVITAVNGTDVENAQDLVDAIQALEPDDAVTLTVKFMDDDPVDVTVTLGENEDGGPYLGVTVRDAPGVRFERDTLPGEGIEEGMPPFRWFRVEPGMPSQRDGHPRHFGMPNMPRLPGHRFFRAPDQDGHRYGEPGGRPFHFRWRQEQEAPPRQPYFFSIPSAPIMQPFRFRMAPGDQGQSRELSTLSLRIQGLETEGMAPGQDYVIQVPGLPRSGIQPGIGAFRWQVAPGEMEPPWMPALPCEGVACSGIGL